MRIAGECLDNCDVFFLLDILFLLLQLLNTSKVFVRKVHLCYIQHSW